MRRWKGILGALTLAVLLPKGQGIDLAKLQPVEAFYIYIEGGKYCIQTDTDAYGSGYTLPNALEDLHSTASAVVFLETADYLLVTEQTKTMLAQLQQFLRPSTKVVVAAGPVEMEDVLPFLKAKEPKATLKDCVVGESAIPKLMVALGRYYLD